MCQDVFKDEVNRDVSMKLLVDAALNPHETRRQYILISPLGTSSSWGELLLPLLFSSALLLILSLPLLLRSEFSQGNPNGRSRTLLHRLVPHFLHSTYGTNSLFFLTASDRPEF